MTFASPVYSYEPPGEQVGQLKGRGQTRLNGTSIRTGRGQEDAESVHQLRYRSLVSSDNNQRPTAQEAEDGMLGERVLFDEPEGSQSSLTPPPPPLLSVVVGVVGGRGRVGGASEAGAIRRLIDAQQSEGSADRRPPSGLLRVSRRGKVD